MLHKPSKRCGSRVLISISVYEIFKSVKSTESRRFRKGKWHQVCLSVITVTNIFHGDTFDFSSPDLFASSEPSSPHPFPLTLCFILAQLGSVSRHRLWMVTLQAERNGQTWVNSVTLCYTALFSSSTSLRSILSFGIIILSPRHSDTLSHLLTC